MRRRGKRLKALILSAAMIFTTLNLSNNGTGNVK